MEWLGSGGTTSEIAQKHPMLNVDIVLEAIRYAAYFSNDFHAVEK
jgi:uncharacterized protein (DUF433 family)